MPVARPGDNREINMMPLLAKAAVSHHTVAMKKTIALYALALAAGAFLLSWLEYKYVTRVFAGEIYILLIAIGFTVLGVFTGHRLTRKRAPAHFEKNTAAIAALGISPREYQTLEHLSQGHSNKEIARAMDVSPNTVKTHLAKLYEKLGVQRRTQAIQKAKELALIP